MNVYYNPEKFGLQTIGEVEYSSGAYEFDLTVIWRDMTSGRLLYDDDSGCSCPVPFESRGVLDLTVGTPHDIADHLQRRINQTCDDEAQHQGCRCPENRAAVTELIGRVHEAARFPADRGEARVDIGGLITIAAVIAFVLLALGVFGVQL